MCLALFCAFAVFASLLFLVCLLGCPDAAYQWPDACLRLIMVLGSLTVTLALPWITDLFDKETGHREG